MSNQLATQTSPYLLQHADNPVDWLPWANEAFERAAKENKPVLLSIGYSACHWCHVMAHESFEHQDTADVMNALYVNVKVDREERPDVDRLYQTAHQLLTQRGGGWPLTMFLHPETRRPFFGGTYFPREARHGLPAFTDLLESVSRYFAEQQEDIETQGERLIDVFRQLEPPAGTDEALDDAPLKRFTEVIDASFDRDYGGLGSAPKFPQTPVLNGLLRRWRATANEPEPNLDALFMVSLSLTRMAEGGIFDHVGGGFCRYAVDRHWEIPHFEKMLYDNGPLLALYAQAWLATGDATYKDAATATADWMLADMRAPNGGFFSSRDADSEGVEGKYYVWTPNEVRDALGEENFPPFAAHYGLDQPANFEGSWHLRVVADKKTVAEAHRLTEESLQDILTAAKSKLLKLREQRVAPGLDDKQLTSWNALAIRGLAIAGRALERNDLIDAAVAASHFMRKELLRDGRLLATYKEGDARLAAYLDDHAFLIDALLETLQSRWDTDLLGFATDLADILLTHFEDAETGGFYFTADDHEQLIYRNKPFADEALPSGNGIAALSLQRLGFLLGETRYLDAAERTLKAARSAMQDYPHGHASLLDALEESLDHPEIVIIRGDADDVARWRDSASRLYAPRRLVFAIPNDVADLPEGIADKKARDGETLAYRCLGTHCEAPVSSFEALAASLAESNDPG